MFVGVCEGASGTGFHRVDLMGFASAAEDCRPPGSPSLRSPQSGEFASLVTALHTGFIADMECGDKNRRFGLARSAWVGDGESACD